MNVTETYNFVFTYRRIHDHQSLMEVLVCMSLRALKGFPLTGRGGLQGYEMLRIQHCLDNQLIDRLSAPRTGRTLLPRNIILFF
jgi:hypothetical protein